MRLTPEREKELREKGKFLEEIAELFEEIDRRRWQLAVAKDALRIYSDRENAVATQSIARIRLGKECLCWSDTWSNEEPFSCPIHPEAGK